MPQDAQITKHDMDISTVMATYAKYMTYIIGSIKFTAFVQMFVMQTAGGFYVFEQSSLISVLALD